MPSTANEQMFLELINSARLDPLGDASRYISSYGTQATSSVPNINSALDFFNVHGPTLLNGTNGFAKLNPAQPVAWNDQIAAAARGHSQTMINAQQQDHFLGSNPGTRLTAQGYSWTNVGENIYAFTEDPLQGHAGFMVDWGNTSTGIQAGAGHRVNIMNSIWREVGVGVLSENTGGNPLGPLVVTQDFATRQNSPAVFILGVAYTDTTTVGHAKNDNFYSVGEGMAGLTVSLGTNTATEPSGGYVLATNLTGQQTITFSGAGAGLDAPVTFQANLVAGKNIKLDVVDGNTLQTSVSGTVAGADITTVKGLGLTGLALTTGDGAQTLVGTKGNDTLSGGAGNDQMSGGSGNDTYVRDSSGDVVTEGSGKGTDTVKSAVSYTLPSHVEKLTLTGSGNINGTGNSAGNTITGNSGNNVLNGKEGADTVKGGAGDDTLVWHSSDTLLDGQTGAADTLKVVGSGLNLNLTTIPNSRIVNVERIDLTGSGTNKLTLSASDVVDISSTGNTLTVLGNAGDKVVRGSAWTKNSNVEIDGIDFYSYTKGSATLLVDMDITSVVS